MDSFYKVLSHEQHELAALNNYNFDHPDAFDFDLVSELIARSFPVLNYRDDKTLVKPKLGYSYF